MNTCGTEKKLLTVSCMTNCVLLLLVNNVESNWWSLLSLTNLTNLISLQNLKHIPKLAVFRKIMNNQHHACRLNANYYLSVCNVHFNLASSTE